MKKVITIVSAGILLVGCMTMTKTPQVVENPPGHFSTNELISYQVSPTFSNTVEALREAARVSAPANPFAGMLEYLLSGAVVVATSVAAYKTRQANANEQLLYTTVQGVETANLPEAKRAIQHLARAKGIEPALNKVVYRVTKS